MVASGNPESCTSLAEHDGDTWRHPRKGSMSAITAMVSGSLIKDAELKVSSSGNQYLSLVVRIPTNSQLVRASLWGDDIEACQGLRRGDAVAVVGSLDVGIWQSHDGPILSMSMMAHRCNSAAMKKPKKSRATRSKKPTASAYKAAAEAQAVLVVQHDDGLADDLPWD